MKTRKQMLFDAKKKAPDVTLVPTTVNFKLDRPNGRLHTLQPTEKMICAVRRVLAEMSRSDPNGCRYYLDGKKVQVLSPPVSPPAKPGEPRTYRASGRAKIGVAHRDGNKSSKYIQFQISFRDTKNDLGLDDVKFLEETTVEEIPKNGPLNMSALS